MLLNYEMYSMCTVYYKLIKKKPMKSIIMYFTRKFDIDSILYVTN